MEFKKIAVVTETSEASTEDIVNATVSASRKSFEFSKVISFLKSIVLKSSLVIDGLKTIIAKLAPAPRNVMSFAKRKSHDNVESESFKRPQPRNPKNLKKAAVLIVALFIMVSGFLYLRKNPEVLNSSDSNDQTEVSGPEKTLNIDKDFYFPLKDSEGEELSKIKYNIEKVELRDEIIVKGQKATAVAGRTFLIIYLKVTNEYKSNVDINTRDYVRLSINGNEDEWLAPDIHNDPVEVQAQSTKATRLGFPMSDTDTNLVLRVGEINGDKEKVELNF